MALSKTSSSSSSAATSPPPSSSYASSSTAVQLILATSCNDVFVDPKQILDEGDAANAPDPTKCLSSWESPMASKAGLVVANIRLVVPLGAKIPDKIAQLQLTILCNEVMTFPSGPFESNQPFKDKIIIDAATDHPISPGNLYVWDVPLLIPWNAAAYERGRLGRNYWHITAKMTFPGRLFMSKTLSAQKNLFVINAPMNHSALSYQHIHTGVADGLGALQLSFISNLFTTGGYLRGALLLPSPSPTVKIHGISMTMIQTVTLQSRRRHRHFEKCPEDRFEFFSLRGSDMENAITHCGALCRARPAVGQEIELEWVARLPKDEKARPTTLPGGDTHIRLSHHLELSLLYDVDKDNPVRDQRGNILHKRYRITWPVDLISCAVQSASWMLPEYSAQDQNPVPPRGRDIWDGPTEHETQDHCNCGRTLAEILAPEAASDYSANDLLREGLMMEGHGAVMSSAGRSRPRTTSRHRSRSRRAPRGPATVPSRSPSGTTTPAAGRERVGREEGRRRRGSNNPSSTSGTSTPTPAATAPGASRNLTATNTPTTTSSPATSTRTPRSRSRVVTPDRISIEYESGPDDQVEDGTESEHSSSDIGGDAWEEEDRERLMDKLERERQKREQLYDPNVGGGGWWPDDA